MFRGDICTIKRQLKSTVERALIFLAIKNFLLNKTDSGSESGVTVTE